MSFMLSTLQGENDEKAFFGGIARCGLNHRLIGERIRLSFVRAYPGRRWCANPGLYSSTPLGLLRGRDTFFCRDQVGSFGQRFGHRLMKRLIFMLGLLAMISVAWAADLEAGKSTYVIHDGQALLADKDPDAAVVTKLKTHKEYDVLAISGKWAQLKAGSSTGWVYIGNLSRDEPPDINTSKMSTEASATTLNAAARGLDNDAKGYASRKGEGAAASDVVWMENENASVTKADVKAYLQEHKLGEYQ